MDKKFLINLSSNIEISFCNWQVNCYFFTEHFKTLRAMKKVKLLLTFFFAIFIILFYNPSFSQKLDQTSNTENTTTDHEDHGKWGLAGLLGLLGLLGLRKKDNYITHRITNTNRITGNI